MPTTTRSASEISAVDIYWASLFRISPSFSNIAKHSADSAGGEFALAQTVRPVDLGAIEREEVRTLGGVLKAHVGVVGGGHSGDLSKALDQAGFFGCEPRVCRNTEKHIKSDAHMVLGAPFPVKPLRNNAIAKAKPSFEFKVRPAPAVQFGLELVQRRRIHLTSSNIAFGLNSQGTKIEMDTMERCDIAMWRKTDHSPRMGRGRSPSNKAPTEFMERAAKAFDFAKSKLGKETETEINLAIGLSQGAFGKWLSGRRDTATIPARDKIEAALGISARWLFEGVGTMMLDGDESQHADLPSLQADDLLAMSDHEFIESLNPKSRYAQQMPAAAAVLLNPDIKKYDRAIVRRTIASSVHYQSLGTKGDDLSYGGWIKRFWEMIREAVNAEKSKYSKPDTEVTDDDLIEAGKKEIQELGLGSSEIS